jgi:hypothetical protein
MKIDFGGVGRYVCTGRAQIALVFVEPYSSAYIEAGKLTHWWGPSSQKIVVFMIVNILFP